MSAAVRGECPLSPLEALATVAAGLGAGTINTIVGSGTLLTFPTLLAIGYSPLVANVSNTVGLVPGVVGGVYGYRAELRGQRQRLLRLGTCSLLGGLTGGILLLAKPERLPRHRPVPGHRGGAADGRAAAAHPQAEGARRRRAPSHASRGC